jgi:hypothetical protein
MRRGFLRTLRTLVRRLGRATSQRLDRRQGGDVLAATGALPVNGPDRAPAESAATLVARARAAAGLSAEEALALAERETRAARGA